MSLPVPPLQGRSVVITRPAEQAAELARLLEAAGARVLVRPLVGIAPVESERLASVLRTVHEYDWIVFTSVNAVRACASAAPPEIRWPRCACVGAATAAAARSAGLTVALVPEEFSAEGLAAAWNDADVAGKRVLWPRASAAREVLAERLRAAGGEVEVIDAYRTVIDPEAARRLHQELRATPADVLLFTSPSAVRAFAAAGATPRECVIGVIGAVTAAAATAAGLPVHVQPERHTMEALVAELVTRFASTPSSGNGHGVTEEKG